MILGFLGTGRIASSVIKGIFKSKLKIKKIYISPRNKIIAKKLSKRFKKITISRNNQQLIDKSNWVFLAVTPKVGDKILKKLNFKKNEELKVYLFIKYKDKLVHRDTLFLLPMKEGVVKKIVNEEQFLIKGIVIDRSLTKIGKDYHDFFYKEYLVTKRNYPFIIKIVEKPAMGRSSILSIEVDRKKIHEFFARPEEDYLKANVAQAMRKLRGYNQKRKATFQKQF